MTEKLDGLSMNIEAEARERLKSLFPGCFTDGKLDVKKLSAACGEFDTVDENDREKYEFRWKGKQETLQLAGKRSAATLRPHPEESVNWDDTKNIYIEGDNLEVLKLLQTAYFRQVKMIYIDPPYNTGNDFVYEDNFADPLARYLEVTSQATKSNPESMGRFHTNWLNMMYPRLRLAANLLRDDGVIFISIDDNEVFNLKKVCDEIFGEENYVDCLHWKRKKQPSFLAKHTAKLMEYVLVYAKHADMLEKLSIETLSDATKKVINISNPEATRHFEKGVRVKIGEKGIINAGRYRIKTMEVEYLQDVHYENGKTTNAVDVMSKFSVGQDKINQSIRENLLFITENRGLRRDVSEEEQQNRKSITDLLLSEYGDNQDSDNEQKALFGGKFFDYCKPVKLIYNLTKSLLYRDADIILDFFSGSSTTAHAVMQLNAEDNGARRFIMVQLPELCDEKSEAAKAGYANICEIGKERIRRAGLKVVSDQWLVVSKKEKAKYGCKELSRVDCMAESDASSQTDLPIGKETAERGDVFFVGSDAEGGGFDSVEHSGGSGAKINERISAISGNSQGVKGGIGNATPTMRSDWVPCRFGYFGDDEPIAGSGENVGCPHKHTNHCPLTTNHFPDVGFRVFKLDSSNLKLWDDSPITGENAAAELEARIRGMLDVIKPDRSAIDVVYEVMLKLGNELSTPIVPIELECRNNNAECRNKKNGNSNDGKRIVYGVGEGVEFIVCLLHGVTPEDAAAMAKYTPEQVIFADACFGSTEEKSNVRLTLKDKGIGVRTL